MTEKDVRKLIWTGVVGLQPSTLKGTGLNSIYSFTKKIFVDLKDRFMNYASWHFVKI